MKKETKLMYGTGELEQMLALPFDIKIRKAEQRIREAVDMFGEEGVYLSFSGGKDSQVLLDILTKKGYNIPIVYCNTGLEDRGSRLIAEQFSTVTVRPKLTFRQIIEKSGYPVISKDVATAVNRAKTHLKKGKTIKELPESLQRKFYGGIDGIIPYGGAYNFTKWAKLIEAPFNISNLCCEVNKEKPLKDYEKETKRIPLIATLAVESRRRRFSWRTSGCNAFNTDRPTSRPIMIFTEQDILHYIKSNNIQIAPEYGDIIETKKGLELTGVKRTGCIYCMFGISLFRDKFLNLKKREPKLFEYVMGGGEFRDGLWVPSNEGLGFKFVIDWLNDNLEVFKDKKILY